MGGRKTVLHILKPGVKIPVAALTFPLRVLPQERSLVTDRLNGISLKHLPLTVSYIPNFLLPWSLSPVPLQLLSLFFEFLYLLCGPSPPFA